MDEAAGFIGDYVLISFLPIPFGNELVSNLTVNTNFSSLCVDISERLQQLYVGRAAGQMSVFHLEMSSLFRARRREDHLGSLPVCCWSLTCQER